jgi:uncharacterized membrane protein YjjP (DUF1212 family)
MALRPTLSQTLQLCMEAGQVMLSCGAETSRVEDTIQRLAMASGVDRVESFVTPTGLFIMVESGDASLTQLARIKEMTIDLNKVSIVNDISRKYSRGECTIEEAIACIQAIGSAAHPYPNWLRQLCAGISGASFTWLFGGRFEDLLPGAISAILANALAEIPETRIPRFLSVFTGALGGSLLGILLLKFGIGEHIRPVILGAIIPLLPGLAITNAIRDLMAGDLLAGVARSGEATLTSISIAVAVVIALSLLGVPI